MKRFRNTVACAVCGSILLVNAAWAQPAAGDLSDAEMRGRISEIQTAMNGGEGSMRLWWWGWLGIYGAFTAGSFTIAALADGDTERITYNVSGVQSALGVVGMLISPQAAGYGPARIRRLPEGNTGELRAKITESERLMDQAAEDEIMGRSWITHALAILVNGGGALVIWKGYGDRIEDDGGNPGKEAILNFVLGTIVSEIQIFTQPTRAIADRDSYRRRHGLQPRSECTGEVRFFAMPSGRGMLMGASLPF
jgi:hypothetical protein